MSKIGTKIENWKNINTDSNEKSFLDIIEKYNQNIKKILIYLKLFLIFLSAVVRIL